MKTRTVATTMLTVAILTISSGMAQARVIVRPRVVVVKPKVVVVKPAPVQKAKVWKNKQSLYQSALRRHSAPSLANSMKALSTLDLSVKGIANEVPWHLFYEICMALAGGQQNKMRKIT